MQPKGAEEAHAALAVVIFDARLRFEYSSDRSSRKARSRGSRSRERLPLPASHLVPAACRGLAAPLPAPRSPLHPPKPSRSHPGSATAMTSAGLHADAGANQGGLTTSSTRREPCWHPPGKQEVFELGISCFQRKSCPELAREPSRHRGSVAAPGGSGLRAGQLVTGVWGCPPVCPRVPRPQAGRLGMCRRNAWPRPSHAVPQPGPPSSFKTGQNHTNAEILPVPSRRGRSCRGPPVALPTRDLVRRLRATGGPPSAGFASVGLSHEEWRWPGRGGRRRAWRSPLPASPWGLGAKAPGSGQERKPARICMPRLHPAATKLPADEHRRTSRLFPNLWRQKQGGEGEGE